MNIHRSPLNGRNFEYFSEDPYLTGIMAVSELKGMHRHHVTGMIKHFSCNNQEFGRHTIDSVVSKRALREIYLKGYEMAVKEGGAYLIMSTYGLLNGTHTASSFDQNETILRKEWGFKGIVATDWWTYINEEGGESSREYTSFMIRGANDIYMCSTDAENNANKDDSEEGLKKGVYTRAELERNAKRILTVAMGSLAYDFMNGEKDEWEVLNVPKNVSAGKVKDLEISLSGGEIEVDPKIIDTSRGTENRIKLHFAKLSRYKLVMELNAKGSELAQIPMTLSLNGTPKKVISLTGNDVEFREETMSLETYMTVDAYLSMSFGQDGITIRRLRIVEE